MDYHREYHDDKDLIPTWHLLKVLALLRIGKFTPDYNEHWTTWTLTIQYRDE